MQKKILATLVLALAAPSAALAQSPSDLATLRQELEAMRLSHEARLRTLEQRLQAAEKVAAAAVPGPAAVPAAAGAAAPAPAVAPTLATAPDAAAPIAQAVAARPVEAASAFNPAIALILSGTYTRTSQDPARYAITGFPLPSSVEVGPGTRSFSLAESELDISASIDPWFRGAINFALHPDDSVSVEEAYVQTTSLGHGLSLKAGRFFSNIGYLNPQHAHRWDFVDNPLAYRAMLGTQYGDDGVQLTWLAPTDRYIEFGLELGRGRSFPGGDDSRNGAGMAALTAHTGGDIGVSQSWRAGVSVLGVKAGDQTLTASATDGDEISGTFSGRTRVWIADAVWKWAPNGNATRTNLKLQGEFLHSTRSGDLVYDLDGAAAAGAYRSRQSGWYLQGVYQFMPRWRVGVRTERLSPGTRDGVPADGPFAAMGYHPRKHTLMLDFNPSEFSRLRVQLARDLARQGLPDNQFSLQYQMSLGAHGAHRY